jgi:exosortase/archaeosortase family protein
MPRWWNSLRSTLPAPFAGALGVSAAFFLFVAWDQAHWWRIKEDYSFGWLVPVFVALVVRDRWPGITATLGAAATTPSAQVSGWRQGLVTLGAVALLVAGAGAFLLGAFYRAAYGTSQPGTFMLTIGAVTIALPLLWMNAPRVAATPAGSFRADARLRLVALFLFPVLIWLVSAPLVSAVENQVNLALLRRVVAVVAFTFDALGLPIEQQGNVLVLPGGSVGVEDACSGIRSLTGCVFAGSFLAAIFVDRFWKKFALVGAAMVLAFAANLARSLFLTGWAYARGPEAIAGLVHDAAGYAVLALTVVGLVALLPLFNLRVVPRRSRAGRAQSS